MENRIDELLNKPCYVIDFLPQKVFKTANEHFFDVEYSISQIASLVDLFPHTWYNYPTEPGR